MTHAGRVDRTRLERRSGSTRARGESYRDYSDRLAGELAAAEHDRDTLREARDEACAVADDILGGFHEPAHVGAPCHRSGFVEDTRIAGWRERVRAARRAL